MYDHRPGDSYTREENTVINTLIGLMELVKIPRRWLEIILANKRLLSRRSPSILNSFIYYVRMIRRSVYHLVRGEWTSMPPWLVDVIRRMQARRR